jgi:hypothetical protein
MAIAYSPLPPYLPESRQFPESQKLFINPQLVLGFGVNANLLRFSPDRSLVQFNHQLLHEFFTACELKRLFELAHIAKGLMA